MGKEKEDVDNKIVIVKCNVCMLMFESKPHDWDWENDTNGPPFQYPPECPRCGSSETTVEEKSDIGYPGRIIPERHYDSVSGRVLASMEKIIDRFYNQEKADYVECKDVVLCADHIFQHIDIVHDFLEELKHCDEPLAPYVEENDAGAESPAKK